jgi:hypothetical protein
VYVSPSAEQRTAEPPAALGRLHVEIFEQRDGRSGPDGWAEGQERHAGRRVSREERYDLVAGERRPEPRGEHLLARRGVAELVCEGVEQPGDHRSVGGGRRARHSDDQGSRKSA